MRITQEHKAKLIDELSPTEMGPVIASRTMKRLRADGVMDTITIEIGAPREIDVPYGQNPSRWVCNARISGMPRILAMTAGSSLDAIFAATYLLSGVLSKLPFAPEIDMSLLPYFALPIDPVTTTPEQLDAEQKRPKKLRIDMDTVIANIKEPE